MKYPTINKQPMRTVNIPELSGGVNLRDGVSAVNDDQLTDCENVWFADGLLKTRPAFVKETDIPYDGYTPVQGEYDGTDFQKENATKIKNGIICRLISVRTNWKVSGTANEGSTRIRFIWVGSDNNGKTVTEELPYISYGGDDKIISHFTVQFKKSLYCFCETSAGGNVYGYYGGYSWGLLGELDYYIPTVVTHCKASHTLSDGYAGELEVNGTQLEGYNTIGNYYKLIYSTVNTSADVTGDSYTMAYGIPEDTYADKYKGMYVKANYIDVGGHSHGHAVQLQGKPSNYWVWEEYAGTDGLVMGVSARQIRFKVGSKTGADATLTESDYIEDNLEIIAPYISDSKSKVFAMTRSVWFGGDAKGLSGGTRLFLCGNTQENERSLVMWSGLNDPLYFPENCYAYVGNSNQTAVAFGRQSDMLVIFKENETFFTRYTQNDSITADELINQSVVDYTASSVYFPMIQLHSSIGCDCPDTVQLCRNRLVWACSDGNVYTLVSENQYNERAIFKISEMVKRRLSAENFTNAYSADVNGKYFLFTGSSIYVMDYESYGYNYISSYTKTDDAQLRIPWWYWSIEQNHYLPIAISDTLLLFAEGGSSSFNYEIDFRVFSADGDSDSDDTPDGESKKIQTMLKTKAFDFGAPAYTKDVPLVNIAFGNNAGEPVTVEFTSDKGNCGIEEVTLSDGADDEYSPEYVHNRQLRPCAHGVTRFVVTVKCNGAVSVDSISLNYRTLGGARN